MRSLGLMLVLSSGLLYGQAVAPYISPRGIVNAASFAPIGAPNGPIARGSIFTIFGVNLGPSTGVQVSAFPLPTSLSGVSVRVFQGSTTVDAFPIYVNSGQVNVIMPSNAPLGNASVQVTVGGVQSNVATLKTTAYAPGIFSVLGSGYGPGVIQNYVAQGNTPVNSAVQTAAPGQLVILWATGLGPVSGGDNVPPPVGNLPVNLRILVGGQPVTNLQYGGRAPNLAALDQIVFGVPDNAPAGCFVPVELVVNGALSNVVTMAIQPGGAPCVEAGNPSATALMKGGKNGNLGLTRRTVDSTDPIAGAQTITIDAMTGYFSNEPSGNPFAFQRFVSLPPPGSCTAFTARGDLLDPATILPSTGKGLDAGSVTLSGPRGTKQVAPKNGSYDTALNANPQIPNQDPSTLFLDPGAYQLNTAGGVDVGGLARSLTLSSSAPAWSNRTQFSSVDRTKGLALSWTGNGSVLFMGSSFDQPTNSSGLFICRAAAGATSLTVPPEILGLLPASRANAALTPGYLFFVASPTDFPLNLLSTPVSGLDFASLAYARVTGQVAAFR
jgi:uncharacterized protein (TIGR03437 family)